MANQPTPKTTTLVEPLAHSPDGAAARLNLPLRAIYSLLAAGELRSYKVGRRRLIPDAECQRFQARRLAEAAK